MKNSFNPGTIIIIETNHVTTKMAAKRSGKT